MNMLSDRVTEFTEKNSIDLNNMHLLCCVSGGADSMALLHFFFLPQLSIMQLFIKFAQAKE